ncbi:Wax synthase domain [Sesbania bispinosa]|nr:Wax synthase domain [Sesbania bispinosa]
MVAVLTRTILGIELEPRFNEPYLSSSLQDWGRRWNPMPSKILRPTVYQPTKQFALRLFGPKWASLLALFVTFLISGLVHELIFYYLGRVKPTWEITWFFLLHGFCLLLEVSYKKKLTTKFRLSRVVFGPLTVGFVMVTAYWLFFPHLLRCNVVQRALQEYAAMGTFAKKLLVP